MITAIETLSQDTKFDYCVIGTGPAGMTVAIKLGRAGKKIALLEGGGEQYSQVSQNIYRGQTIGDNYFSLDASRLRFLGGTSNHWAGWCKSLDAEDFEIKGNYKKTKWPISKNTLDKYLIDAKSILELGDVKKDSELKDSGLRQTYFYFSTPPVKFAKKYNNEIASSKNISLLLNANVTSFDTNEFSVTTANVHSEENDLFTVKADQFVLATGGIENSRILLWGNVLTKGNLVKNSTTLGKYWMEHPVFSIGEAILNRDLTVDAGPKGIVFYSPTKKTMNEHEILNCSLRFEPKTYEGTKKIIADLACVAPSLGKRVLGLLDKELICGAKLRASWEQEPVESNRIELSRDLDRYGVPRPILYWRKSDTGLKTVRRTAETFGKFLAEHDLGRIKLDAWVYGNEEYPSNDELAGYHHMGGTRMASNAEEGVVDKNCKLFGQSNFYIAGSSVFPSGGYANPTLTIVQLALRLSNHLLNQ